MADEVANTGEAANVTATDAATFVMKIDKGTDPAVKQKNFDLAKEVSKINREKEENRSEIPEALRDVYKQIMDRDEKPRDEKGRFLPQEGKEKSDAEARTEKAEPEPVAEEAVVPEDGEPDDSEGKARPGNEDGDEAAESLDYALVVKAARLGMTDEELDEITSNAELRVAVRTMERHNAKPDQTAKARDVAPTKAEAEPEAPQVDFDKMIEEGHDEGLVKQLKFLTETVHQLRSEQKTIREQKQAEEQSRLAEQFDDWFSKTGGQYGEGKMSKYGPKSPEAVARNATIEKVNELYQGALAVGKHPPPLGELLEQAHILLNPKQVERDAVRKVAKKIEQTKRTAITPPAQPKAETPKHPSSLRDVFAAQLQAKGLSWNS